jgi:hypothetical protein
MEIPAELRAFLMKRSGDELMWPYYTVADVNLALRLACHSAGLMRITSYSIRHAYMKRVLDYCAVTGENPTVYTGHLHQNTLQAHYNEEAFEDTEE